MTWPTLKPPMAPDVAKDLSDSQYEFHRLVWPALGERCGGGQILSTEGVGRDLEQNLDVLGGVDAFQVLQGEGMRGIASRVQWHEPPMPDEYMTFTVRKSRANGAPTEYDKRLRAVENPRGFLYPHLTTQAYLSPPRRSGELLSAAVALTRDVVRMIRDGEEGFHYQVRETHNAEFYVLRWWVMRGLGLRVDIVPGGADATADTYIRLNQGLFSLYPLQGEER